MSYYAVAEIPHAICKSREILEETRTELESTYDELLRSLLQSERDTTMLFHAPAGGGQVEVGYEIGTGSDLSEYLRTLRRFMRLHPGSAPKLASDISGRLIRRVNLVGVGATDKIPPSMLELLPTNAHRFADTDPRIGAATVTTAAIFPATVWMCEAIRRFVPQAAYLAPVPQNLSIKRSPSRWRNTISTLAIEGGSVRISCSKFEPNDDLESYALLCLQYYLRTMDGKVPQDQLYNATKAFFAVLAKESLLRMDICFYGCSQNVLEAFQRDTDPQAFELSGKAGLDWASRRTTLRPDFQPSRETRRLPDLPQYPQCREDSSHVARQWSNLFLVNEAIALLTPPYTFRDAIRGLKHFVPKPFHAPAVALSSAKDGIVLGLLETGDLAVLTPREMTRHIYICGCAGSGKTHSIQHLVSQLREFNVPVLIIDPVKRDFEPLMEQMDAGDCVYDFRRRWLRFNPFIPSPKTTLYNHSVVLAKSFSMLFPTNAVAYEILQRMVRETYRRKLSGRRSIDTESFMHRTGGDLRRYPELAPTFQEFLDIGLELLLESGREMMANSPRGVSPWLQEALEHFRRRWESLRGSAFSVMLSPHENPVRTIDFLFGGVQLVEFGAWFDTNEVNAAFALLFSMLYEQSRDEYETALGEGVEPSLRIAVLDEAHRIVPADTGGGDEKLVSAAREASDLFCHMIAECRAMGQGLIVAEQSTSRINPNVLVNTSTKLIHTTLYGRDKEMLGAALSLSEEEQNYASYLRQGETLACLPGVYNPVALRIPQRIGARRIHEMGID